MISLHSLKLKLLTEITFHIFWAVAFCFCIVKANPSFKGSLSWQKKKKKKSAITELGASIVSVVARAMDECFQQKLKEIMSL